MKWVGIALALVLIFACGSAIAQAPGPGNLAVLFGSTTGRDGIGGASVLASATFGDDERQRLSREANTYHAGGRAAQHDFLQRPSFCLCARIKLALPFHRLPSTRRESG